MLLYPNGKGTAYSVPKGTGTIEKYAFYQSKLEKITLPEGLKTIKDNAFTTCFHLTGITIPKSVTRMNILDFKYLDSLQSFHMESGSKLYVSYEGILYNTARTKIIFVPKAYKKTVLKFPSTLTGLNLSSFNLKDTTEIIIPKALKELETYTDSGKCFNKISIESGNKNFILYQGSLYNKNKTELYLFKKQEKAEFPDTLKNINIFYLRNSGIKEMIIPENAQIITWIDNVYDIPTLERVSVVKDSKYYTLENGLLLSKDKTILYDIPRDIKELKIPDTVKSVNSSLTFRKTDLKSVSIPESAVDINYSDFMYLKSAVSIEADKNNNAFTSINGVLYNKDVTVLIYYPVNKTDKTYVMPDTVKYILNPESITDNPYLESITLSGALEYRDYGFVKSNSLKEINVDDSNAYYKSLEGVLYNKEMTVLVAYPFQKTDKTFIVPDTVMEVSGFCYSKDTMLDDYQYTVNAFSNPYLETLVIGKKVKTLFTVYDNYTIWDFKNLQKIEVSNDNPFFSSKDGILYNKEFSVMYLYPRDCRNEVLTIPGSVREIQDTFINAAVNNKYLKSISLVSDNKAFSTDGITLSNYAGNHIYLRIGDTNYGKRIFSD
ncbi:leucine-rich repeat protein [Anaerocolumna sedimenticola]|uniref:Leucine-rich repeat protein n=1 Tax=Anaerocolumna sedimenticola TaxID=2696063 RepID=A0A6P1TSF4_9FIRM|nr:leucine-rich repeat protein [Anaerocolumna sedimenticola]QHQ63864.1 leucine-rich repeat protein [Anaerocolumna sedimenticola]